MVMGMLARYTLARKKILHMSCTTNQVEWILEMGNYCTPTPIILLYTCVMSLTCGLCSVCFYWVLLGTVWFVLSMAE